VASIPEMVNVGGTTLSVTADGGWLGEQAWFDVPLSLGTSGGVSELFDKPDWQRGVTDNVPADRNRGRRLTPDVAAVADPFTGVRFLLNGEPTVGGGTSQAAPIWAGLAAVMNQYLLANGGRQLGDLNPLLYQMAAGARLPGFRDITLGGNAVDSAAPGYDLVTGLGTPNVANLVQNVQDIQGAAQ
jgi:kumamolisin